MYVHIGYDDDGHLMYTDKKTGRQKISIKSWPNPQSARVTMSTALGRIEWEQLDEPPAA